MYYFWANNAQAGPYTLNQVRSMWNNGQINGTTVYWKEGMTNWSPLSEIVHIIEDPAPVREVPRRLEIKKSREDQLLPAMSIGSIQQWLLNVIFVLSLIAFFLPVVSVTMPLLGTESASMFDLVTTKPGNSGRENSFSREQSGRLHQAPNLWDDLTENKESAGAVICMVSLFLLMGHYALTVIWGVLVFVFGRTYAFLTFLWLSLAVQFPIIFLIGGQILIGGIKNQMAGDTARNPFAAFGQALVDGVSIQPGVATWFVMALSLGASILLLAIRRQSS